MRTVQRTRPNSDSSSAITIRFISEFSLPSLIPRFDSTKRPYVVSMVHVQETLAMAVPFRKLVFPDGLTFMP